MGGAVAAEHMTEPVRLPERSHWHAAMPCLKNPRPGTGPVLDALSDLRGIPASMSGGRLLSSGTEFCLGQQEAVVTGRSDMQDASSGSDPRQQRLDPSIAKMRFDSRHCPLQAARRRPSPSQASPPTQLKGLAAHLLLLLLRLHLPPSTPPPPRGILSHHCRLLLLVRLHFTHSCAGGVPTAAIDAAAMVTSGALHAQPPIQRPLYPRIPSHAH